MEELVLKFSKKVQEAMNTLYMDVRIHHAYLHYKIIWLKGKSQMECKKLYEIELEEIIYP